MKTAIYDSVVSVSQNLNFYSVKLFGGTVARKILLPLKTLKKVKLVEAVVI
jgi:hypothetical protein